MKVSLIASTSCNIDGVFSLAEQIAYMARVSNPENQNSEQSPDKLISYLIRNKHWSPFEMVSATVEIEVTRDIARQILRHRSFSFQEFSQRYSAIHQLGFAKKECRLQDTKNRQNSLATENEELKQDWDVVQMQVLNTIKDAYVWALDHGIAKEQARAVLPEGMTMSRMYMSGTIRSWYHYVQLRTTPGTQKEHREVALACANEIANVFPNIRDAIYTAEAETKSQ